ncbi:ExbD/TolR family protein [Microbulbifer taiwanensis]|uniref:ExbD/TolR family protein n=1 Tax=Microbulbifer taiwanensis TaxID=986746 RepID=UPI003623FD9F
MRRRRQGRNKEAPELDITAFLNLMVVLVPFLLVSAVFSRVTILELNMPSGAGGGAPDDPRLPWKWWYARTLWKSATARR